GGLGQEIIKDVMNLVMVTKTHQPDSDSDGCRMVDVDLSIFGQAEKRFLEYESQIRLEYSWVPESVFNLKRAEILQDFLDHDFLFRTPLFRNLYEDQARRNLSRSLGKL